MLLLSGQESIIYPFYSNSRLEFNIIYVTQITFTTTDLWTLCRGFLTLTFINPEDLVQSQATGELPVRVLSSALTWTSSFLFLFLPLGMSLPPDRAWFPQLTPLNAWDRLRQQNKEKVGEPKWGSDRGREFPVWVKRWSYTAIFRSGMLLYETGKLPPSVYGWGLSDRGDYLYLTTHTHVCARTHATAQPQGKARKGGLFKTKHSSAETDVIQRQLHQISVSDFFWWIDVRTKGGGLTSPSSPPLGFNVTQ